MSGNKFNRQFIMEIDIGAKQYLSITSPFTLEFSIVKHNMGASNIGNFTIYNLNKDTRGKIYKDDFDIVNQPAIQLFAGYADEPGQMLPRCFNGTVRRAYSHRQGSEFRTVIEAFDGPISMGAEKESVTLPAGTTQAAVIEKLATAFKGVDKVNLGTQYTKVLKRSMAVVNDTMSALTNVTNGGFYISDGAAYALSTDDVIPGLVAKINADNGLLGTPKKSQAIVEVEMLFEPRLKISQMIELESATDNAFNGTYKIVGLTHRGTISGAVCGDCRTTVNMVSNPSFKQATAVDYEQYRILA